jgi:hypothetical protein
MPKHTMIIVLNTFTKNYNIMPNNNNNINAFPIKGKRINKLLTTTSSKKIKLVLDVEQQQQILDIWLNIDYEKGYAHATSSYDVFSLKLLEIEIKRIESKTMPEILKILGFDCIENRSSIKLTHFNGNLDRIKPLFYMVAHIVKPSSYITLISEEKQLTGWFFNNDTILHYDSQKSLDQLLSPFILNKKLNKNLEEKKVVNKKNKL